MRKEGVREEKVTASQFASDRKLECIILDMIFFCSGCSKTLLICYCFAFMNLFIACSYSGAGIEYDQAIVLLPIVDYTKQKKRI